MTDVNEVRSRVYFTVLDPSRKLLPAVEYWAGSLADVPSYPVIPLRKFIKLIGAGEQLKEIGNGVFVSERSGRSFVRVALPGKPAT